MAMVASGSADVYYEWGIHCWDMAAGKLLIEEAGGAVANTEGESSVFHLFVPRVIFYSKKTTLNTRTPDFFGA